MRCDRLMGGKYIAQNMDRKSMDRVHQNIDKVHGPPIFTSPETSSNQRLGVRSMPVL